MRDDGSLPDSVVARAVELTHRARRGDDGARADRDALLADHGYAARVRAEGDDVLVLHPASWTADGPDDPDAVDPDAAIEVPLDGGDYAAVDAFNRRVVDRVRERHGEPHGATAAALADYMGNHHAARIDAATADHLATFHEEYLPRNAWPSDEQLAAAAESVRLTVAAAEALTDATPPRAERDRGATDTAGVRETGTRGDHAPPPEAVADRPWNADAGATTDESAPSAAGDRPPRDERE